jgi:hypothetical protein
MRYLFICLAAFLLLAVPAWAAPDTADVDITVIMPQIYDWHVDNDLAAYEFYGPKWDGEWCLYQNLDWALCCNQNWIVTAFFTPVVWDNNLGVCVEGLHMTAAEQQIDNGGIGNFTGYYVVGVCATWPVHCSPDGGYTGVLTLMLYVEQ